ncbi:MAG: hypothetical protein R2713_14415 [Ilumatobacteraceae bacterium]|nr:hypothetical protein [Acidimicrobiales bacterium]MCB9394479.1 hypothetical protein [Acidimicrobiaceae bacterium]
MSDSSPADLAITFRSLARRLRESRGDLADASIGQPLATIDRHLARAAALVHSGSADPGLIASAIEAVPANGWGAELDELRSIALDLGRQLRSIEAENPDADR